MQMRPRLIASVLLAVAGAASPAAAATWYVAGNGVDGSDCGTRRKPCRSITAALARPATVDGDRIVVGPGRYGDANDDGDLNDPGDEVPAPGCGCVLAINKSVSVTSSHGAAQTVIGARIVNDIPAMVALFMNGGEFGRPGRGFTVTNTEVLSPVGIVIDSGNIAVGGNVVTNVDDSNFGTGIRTVDFPQPMTFEGNQVTGWGIGMDLRGGAKIVKNNVASSNLTGISNRGGTVTGNVAVANQDDGLSLRGPTVATGNAAYGNRHGVRIESFTGTFERNNLSGNDGCGVRLGPPPSDPPLAVPNNYWGAETGPGPNPADDACGNFDPARFASRPFRVKPRLVP